MRTLIAVLLFAYCSICHAQSFTSFLSAEVRYSKNYVDNTYFLSPEKKAEGYYETVELFEADGRLLVRCEEGKTNDYGFIDDESIHAIIFEVSGLTYEWIDKIRQEGILFKGICTNKKLGYDLPFVLKMEESGSDVVAIGHNIKTLGDIRVENIERLFDIGKAVGSNNQVPPKARFKNKVAKKSKPKLTK